MKRALVLALPLISLAACDDSGRLQAPSNYDAAPGESVSKDTHAVSFETAEAVDASMPSENAARVYLGDRAPAGTTLRAIHDTGRGAIIVTFGREVSGLPVFRDEVKVAMKQSKELVAVVGRLSRMSNPSPVFTLAERDALQFAFSDLSGRFVSADAFTETDRDTTSTRDRYFTLSEDIGLTIPARTRRVLFPLGTGLEPAHYIEMLAGRDYVSYVVSASDGRLLFRNDLKSHATYRVWAGPDHIPQDGPDGDSTPHPTGNADGYQAPFVPSSLHTLNNFPFSKNDPWLAAGATKTEGNNVKAYADIAESNGFGAGDVQPTTTAAGVFDRTYDVTKEPNANTTQIMAAVTSLFYLNNFLHDWYYDAGFDEAAGNAQASNFGRGGAGNDPILAEGQDYSGTDNANMATPADGASPRMQMYIFGGVSGGKVKITAPVDLAGDHAAAVAGFGPASFTTSGNVVKASPLDACSALTNAAALNGKIALIKRGSCAFVDKIAAAQTAKAIGVIMVNNVPDAPQTMGGNGSNTTISIPSLLVDQATGTAIINATATVSVQLVRDVAVDRDGTIDNLIVAHEWGHYLSNRLVNDSNGLTTAFSRGLGEGWGDTSAMLLTVRGTDLQRPNNAHYSGVYALATYTSSGGANNGYYFGIRRYPYSTNMKKDPLTFKHIQADEPLPAGSPVAYGEDGSMNTEVHSVGEVWATMLWECYAALLNDPRYTFEQARDRWKGYLVASLKLTPTGPTLLEARDALLAVANAQDELDYATFAKAFAKRGAGLRAKGPARNATDNKPVTEDYGYGNDAQVVGVALTEVNALCTADKVLDDGESGTIDVQVKNLGMTALANATATVSTNEPGITIDNGGVITFGAVAALATASGSVKAKASGLTKLTTAVFTIRIDDSTFKLAGGVTSTHTLRLNYDNLPASSAADDVESDLTTWEVAHDTNLAAVDFVRTTADDASKHLWFGADAEAPADSTLTSPELTVNGDLSFTFEHAFAFEGTAQDPYDGGVLELSADGGAWTDIGDKASPTYNVTLAGGQSKNPIAGRKAFGLKSAGYPALSAVTVKLGASYVGKKVRVRFRMGADDAGASVGWFIDDIAFSGISNTPFATIGDQDPSCNAPPGPTGHTGSVGPTGEEGEVGPSGSVGSTGGEKPQGNGNQNPTLQGCGGCRSNAGSADVLLFAMLSIFVTLRRRSRRSGGSGDLARH